MSVVKDFVLVVLVPEQSVGHGGHLINLGVAFLGIVDGVSHFPEWLTK